MSYFNHEPVLRPRTYSLVTAIKSGPFFALADERAREIIDRELVEQVPLLPETGERNA
jgi:hypothetical protein